MSSSQEKLQDMSTSQGTECHPEQHSTPSGAPLLRRSARIKNVKTPPNYNEVSLSLGEPRTRRSIITPRSGGRRPKITAAKITSEPSTRRRATKRRAGTGRGSRGRLTEPTSSKRSKPGRRSVGRPPKRKESSESRTESQSDDLGLDNVDDLDDVQMPEHFSTDSPAAPVDKNVDEINNNNTPTDAKDEVKTTSAIGDVEMAIEHTDKSEVARDIADEVVGSISDDTTDQKSKASSDKKSNPSEVSKSFVNPIIDPNEEKTHLVTTGSADNCSTDNKPTDTSVCPQPEESQDESSQPNAFELQRPPSCEASSSLAVDEDAMESSVSMIVNAPSVIGSTSLHDESESLGAPIFDNKHTETSSLIEASSCDPESCNSAAAAVPREGGKLSASYFKMVVESIEEVDRRKNTSDYVEATTSYVGQHGGAVRTGSSPTKAGFSLTGMESPTATTTTSEQLHDTPLSSAEALVHGTSRTNSSADIPESISSVATSPSTGSHDNRESSCSNGGNESSSSEPAASSFHWQ